MTEKTVGIGVIGVGMGANLLYVNREANSRLEVARSVRPWRDRAARWPQSGALPFWTTDYRDLLGPR